ncbi:hypothetical protein A2U01_0088424, partial [Trifolium medium]|nr:hypothetical protein [Trifolium medium]
FELEMSSNGGISQKIDSAQGRRFCVRLHAWRVDRHGSRELMTVEA